MKSKKIGTLAILLIISIGNCFRIISEGKIRTVEFLSILAVGGLTVLLLTELSKIWFDKK